MYARYARRRYAKYASSFILYVRRKYREVCAIYVGGVFVRTAKVHNEICAIYYVGHFVCTAKVRAVFLYVRREVFCRVSEKYKVSIEPGILYI